jgi:hypothetical protein
MAQPKDSIIELYSNPKTKDAFLEFVKAILDDAQIFSDCFTNDPNYNTYTEGKRALGLVVLAMLDDADPEIFINILRKGANK